MKTHATNFATPGVTILCNPRIPLWNVPHDDIRPTCKHCRRMRKERDAISRKAIRDWGKR